MECPKCGYLRKISDTAPEYECPACGIVYSKYRARQEKAATVTETGKQPFQLHFPKFTLPKFRRSSPSKHYFGRFFIGISKILAGIVAFIVVLALVVVIIGENTSRETRVKGFDKIDALSMCQYTIQQLARDPETANVPYVDNHGYGDEYYFSWGRSTKFARMKNGLGLEVPVSASCIVDGKQKKIIGLSLEGKTIIAP